MNNKADDYRQSRKSASTDLYRILLAEDDKEMLVLLAQALRRAGYEVIECHNGWELLNQIESLTTFDKFENIDLIISDIRMPGVTGMEVLEGSHKLKGFPLMILITAFGDEQTHEKAERLGVTAVFDKPFDIDDLIYKVRKILPIQE